MQHALTATVLLLMAATIARADERFPTLTPETMTPEQTHVAQAITAGPRGSLAGPFNAWLQSPEIADRMQKVGDYVRFHTSIPHDLNELAILITARQWNAKYEWYAHYQIALKAGLDPAIADAIAHARRPESMRADQRLIYDFCTELHRDRQVSDATFNAVVARFGRQGAIDLIAVSGYYTLVSMTLNVAEFPVPADSTVPALPDLPR